MNLEEKLKILSAAAKYDVSCSSSGSSRLNKENGLGNAKACGICHSFTDDGRCISLLKILFTNYCIYDCAYCINRKSNDIPRASFTVEEVVDLTINFYRRNYIEGLFLSSGIIKNPDYTMEKLFSVVKKLREENNFNGYIHLKAIPGASEFLLKMVGYYVDRLSVNIEIPSEENLKLLAPDKNKENIFKPIEFIGENIFLDKVEHKNFKKKDKKFVPAGQSTQLIVGASPESDYKILKLTDYLYKHKNMKRVYYSAFIPVNEYDKRLPVINKPPLKRENRLYQADWLLRFYKFNVEDIISEKNPFLDEDIDPKLCFALRNLHLFPVEINKASYEMLLRVPGIGIKSAQRIIAARKYRSLKFEDLKKIGVVLKRAKFFITCDGKAIEKKDLDGISIKNKILLEDKSNILEEKSLFDIV
ncbi:MAG TPA: putative DNA modification/repair radical SAM protein [Spirochaetota bacterium]|nr:putative DNA modification/repair radical SAM protein [Spirochaetota bacterium]HOL57933.1 putative DNA modification/repair radical SAM protein [Spirochaetota bacterium]HPP05451.1 putative DNA modification/repair radical SAM protein [Spirochaetota bacterium]